MSLRATKWAWAAIEATEGLTAAASLTLMALADCHNQETGRCDPSLKMLERKTRLNERTVRRALRQLEAAKLIATTRRTVQTGLGKRNLRSRYALTGGGRMPAGVGAGCPTNLEVYAPSAFDDLAMAIALPGEKDWR